MTAGGRRERPLDEHATGPLVARRGRRGAQTAVRKVRAFDVGRRDFARVGAGQQVDARDARLHRNTHAVLRRRHALLNRQRLAHAISGDRREHLPVRLVAGLARHAPARAADLPFHGGTKLAEVGAVGLQRRAVLAPLVEQVAAKARGKRRARLDSRCRPAPRRIRRRPGCRRRRGRPRQPGCSRRSSRASPAADAVHPPRLPPPNSDSRPESRVAAEPSARSAGEVGRRVTTCSDADQRVGAVEIACAASHDLHAIDRSGRHTVPVHPAAKRVVEHLAVGQHQRTAGARGRQAAQARALCRRVRAPRRRAAEQAEPRHDLEHVVERGGRRQREIAGGENGHWRRRAGGSTIAASGRDDDGLGKRRGVEGHPGGSLGRDDEGGAQPGGLDGQPVARLGAVERERAVDAGFGAAIRACGPARSRRATGAPEASRTTPVTDEVGSVGRTARSAAAAQAQKARSAERPIRQAARTASADRNSVSSRGGPAERH